jgi:triacylglycerol lipase
MMRAMNARIQRGQLLLRLLLALGGLIWLWPSSPAQALALAALLFWGYGLVMGVGFASLLWINNQAGPARPSVWQLPAVWWREFWICEWVFALQQPFAEHRQPDHLPERSTQRGVLLLHGFSCNRGLWNHWLPRLRREGHAVIALSMEPALGSIDAYADQIEAALQRLQACTGQPPLVVAHSMGGLALRAWWRRHGGSGAAGRLHRVITLGSPHEGTVMARFGHATNARQMRRDSRWLAALAAGEGPEFRARFLCYYSGCDQVVCPADTAVLPGAEARHRPGLGHLALVFDAQVFDEVLVQLRSP